MVHRRAKAGIPESERQNRKYRMPLPDAHGKAQALSLFYLKPDESLRMRVPEFEPRMDRVG